MPISDQNGTNHDGPPHPLAAHHPGDGPEVLPAVPFQATSWPARGGTTSPALSTTPNATALLKALRRRWLLATTLGLIVAAITATVIWLSLPRGKQTAYVPLFMPIHPAWVFNGHPEDRGDFGNYQRTQFALLRGRSVLNAALSNPKVRALNLAAETKTTSPVEWLASEIRIETPDGPELPRIAMSGDDPEELKVLVMAVVDAYMEEVVHKQVAHRQTHIEELKKIESTYKEHVKRIQRDRNELVMAIGTGDSKVIALKQELNQKQLAQDQMELLKLAGELQELELEARLYQANDGGPVEVPDKLVESYVDKALEKPIAQRVDLEGRLAKARRANEDDNLPGIKRLRDELDQRNKFIEEERKKLRTATRAELMDRARLNSKSDSMMLKQKIAFKKELQQQFSNDIERLVKEAKAVLAGGLGLGDTRIEFEQAEASLKRVTAEIDKAITELPAPPRVSKQEQDAIVVAPNETSRKMKMASMGAGGAFGAVLLLISFLEFRSRRVDSVDNVVQALGLDLMGTLPAAPSRFGGRLTGSNGASMMHWQSMLAESVDSARTLLLSVAGTGKLRTVMVTSATSGEGKTSLATHLAASLARAGHRTLFVDADLRKPTAHRIFDLPLSPGLTEVLRGTIDLAEAVQPTHAEGLFLLPAGTYDGGAIQLVGREPGRSLLERVKQEYDFIVLDSSPILGMADSLLLAQHVDGVLLSLFHEVSRLPQVYLACQRLSLMRVRVLGAVVNGTDEGVFGYGGYGYGAPSVSAAG